MSKILKTITGKAYFEGGICHFNHDLSGKIIVITGCSSGIGKASAKVLAQQNATIIMANRSQSKTELVISEIKREVPNAKLDFIQLDLAELSSIRQFADSFKQKYDHLDVLVNNARAHVGMRGYEATKDGLEAQMAVHHFGPVYLTHLLLDRIQKSKEGRIINICGKPEVEKPFNWSVLEDDKRDYSYFNGIFWSKKALFIYTNALQKQLNESNVTNVKAVVVHPGMVRTEGINNVDMGFLMNTAITVLKPLLLYFGKNPLQGAQTTLYCIQEDFEKLKGGAFYSDCDEFRLKPHEDLSKASEDKIRDWTAQILKEKVGEDVCVVNREN